MIDLITLCTSAVWRLTKLFLSLIICGICFVVVVFMMICIFVMLHGGYNNSVFKKSDKEWQDNFYDDNNN